MGLSVKFIGSNDFLLLEAFYLECGTRKIFGGWTITFLKCLGYGFLSVGVKNGYLHEIFSSRLFNKKKNRFFLGFLLF